MTTRQFAYTGDHDEVEAFGLTFARNAHVDVADPLALKKLPGNPDFVEIVDGAEVAPSGTAEKLAAKSTKPVLVSKAKRKAMQEAAQSKTTGSDAE